MGSSSGNGYEYDNVVMLRHILVHGHGRIYGFMVLTKLERQV